jgi:uncharacterized repeat protein (TIGR03803 family)
MKTFAISEKAVTAPLLGLLLSIVGTSAAHAQTFTVLYTFAGYANGAGPNAGVISDSEGNLYGTTYTGGSPTDCCGVVYKLDTSARETMLYNFTGYADGSLPYAGVIRDSVGNLYGTTLVGGTSNKGVVYKVNMIGKETVLYNFTGGSDGGSPYVSLMLDKKGNFYGTTVQGGDLNCNGGYGCGVVFELDTTGTKLCCTGSQGRPTERSLTQV